MDLSEKIKALPIKSGVYIMRDKSGNIIYIGKAVVLKNRVKQYFSGSVKQTKVQAMVDNIADFDYIITLTEKDALSLEANLIRKHKPKYNILLKDDKSSPYIKINLSAQFPTIEVTRFIKKDGARYFGPYFNGIYVKEIVEIIKSAYRMRTCPKNYNQKGRECLNYHINLCLAPCCGHVSREEYMQVVTNVMAFLSGREDAPERLIEQKMEQAVADEAFERAIMYRDQLAMLKKLKERNLADLGAQNDIDSVAYVTDSYHSVVSVAIVRGGKMMGVKNYSITDIDSSYEDVIAQFLSQYYSMGNVELPEIICLENEFNSIALEEFLNSLGKRKVQIAFPKIGAKKKLINMAKDNGEDYLEKSVEKFEKDLDMTVRAVENLAKILELPSAKRMECYDISNISGVDKVASGVVFINGTESKSDYRRYKIKTVDGANDFASMAEVISRRLKRLNIGDTKFGDLPDLIVVDGGKGQLAYAHAEMEKAGLSIPLIALAEREEHIFTLDREEPIVLDKRSYELKVLIRIRDEAHRFAITYHRNLRSKRYDSRLDKIHGIGPKKRKILLEHFSNFNDLMTADFETLASINGIDAKTARNIVTYFKSKDEIIDEKLKNFNTTKLGEIEDEV